MSFTKDNRKQDTKNSLKARYRPRFFDQVGHQTTYASMENK